MKDTGSLAAPCGLDCFNCELYEENVTDEIRGMLSARSGIPPAEVQCRGCRLQKGERPGLPPCETWKCATGRGVDFCLDCDDFPCSKLQPASDGAQRYPHNLKLFNLCRIKSVGLDAWAKETPGIRRRYFEGKFVIGLGPIDR